MKPLVTVIGISYNHSSFIEAAVQSIFAQSYENLEIILIDDASKDDSIKTIQKNIRDKDIKVILHEKNLGYTKTFNEGLALATGEYIIDFALDDKMKPDFVEKSVACFQNASVKTGVVFSNADYIDSQGQKIANHNEELFRKKMIRKVPFGDVFEWVLKRYFICTPTMVIKKEVFDRLGGYDEGLAYEDFDFWIRSSRHWEYAYVDEVLIEKRKLANSMSSKRYQHHFNEQMNSVFKVCQKAFHLCKSKNELRALRKRINFEFRQCLRTGNVLLAEDYKQLMRDTGSRISFISRFGRKINRSMFPFMKSRFE